jgi:8-oxo-dGTP pyrophosphatase MutT (NUDIX family)
VFKNWLQQRLLNPLPGAKAHETIWSYPRNSFEDGLNAQPPARLSSVNIILQPSLNEWESLFILRSDFGIHGGQVAFPGGKIDAEESKLACAQRETLEEIGIEPNQYKIIGELSPVYIPPSNMIVFPHISFCESELKLHINKDEIADSFWVPFSSILPEKIIFKNHFLKAFDTERNIRGIAIGDHFLWGASAMISQELMHLWMEFQNEMNEAL